MSSDDNKNCWFVLNTTRPELISIPSNSSDGNVDEQDISIGSLALTVNAVSAKKSGVPSVPGLDNITFSPARTASLLRKNNTLLIRLSLNVGNGLLLSSPTSLSAYVNCLIVNVAISLDVPPLAKAVLWMTSGILVRLLAIPGFAHSVHEPVPS